MHMDRDLISSHAMHESGGRKEAIGAGMNDPKDPKRPQGAYYYNAPASANFPVQLPIWPDPVRGGPNALLRSALFAGILSKRRQVLAVPSHKPDVEPEGVVIAAQDGINLKFAGTQLNQYDADVFFEALHRARRHPLETECLFTGHDFLKAIGRSHGKNEYDDLDNSLRRLRRGTVDIEWKASGRNLVFTGSLISHYVRDTDSKLYKVTFAREVRTLFAPASWTQLEWEERLMLKGQPLAQWLHSYFSTHAAPFPVSAGYLHEKSGSESPLKQFNYMLKRIVEANALPDYDLNFTATNDGASAVHFLRRGAVERAELKAAVERERA